jgi:hypothetical protein
MLPTTMSSAIPDSGRSEKPIRIPAEAVGRIRRGRRRLSAETDSDLDDSTIVAEFIEESFDPWVEKKVKALRAAREKESK